MPRQNPRKALLTSVKLGVSKRSAKKHVVSTKKHLSPPGEGLHQKDRSLILETPTQSPTPEPVFSYKLKSRAYFALKSEFKRACRRFSGLCAPPRTPSSPQTRYSASLCHMGVCASSISSKIRVHPSREKPDQKKSHRNLARTQGRHLRSFIDGLES